MALPTIEGFMIFALRALSDGGTHTKDEIYETVSKATNLTSEDMQVRNSAGLLMYKAYIHWSIVYLTKAGLINQPTKGVGIYNITNDGKEFLAKSPTEITQKTLLTFKKYQEYIASITNRKAESNHQNAKITETISIVDPLTRIEEANIEISGNLKNEILGVLKNVKPFFFEKVVVDLIEKMGYSSGHEGSSRAFCMGSDGGVDGVVEEDRLGLDKIYIQAKRWSNTVGRPELQQFAGTLIGKHAHKGVFITTSDFSKEARDFVKDSGSNISLINGEKLVSLMIEFGLGVSLQKRIDILKVDHDYFNDEEY